MAGTTSMIIGVIRHHPFYILLGGAKKTENHCLLQKVWSCLAFTFVVNMFIVCAVYMVMHYYKV